MPSKTKPAAPTEAAIRERAYFLWEAAGRPEGTGDHFWHLALAEAAQTAASDPGFARPPKVKAKAGSAKASAKGKPKAESDAPKAKPKSKSAEARPAKRATPKPRAAIQPPK